MKFIVTSDWHLRATKPRCRLDDDWFSFQENIVSYIINKANEYKCDIKIIGDIFDTPNVPSIIASMFIRQVSKCEKGIEFIAGNHDLPFHSLDNINNSTIGIIYEAAQHHSKIYHGISCGLWNDFGKLSINGLCQTGLVFTHQLVFENKKSVPPNSDGLTSSDILELYPTANWIFCGDNHTSFHYEKNGKHVVNPGCINRQSSDQKNYRPIIYFIDIDKEIVEEINLPDIEKIVDDSYIIEQESKESRIAAFVEKLKKNEVVELDFMKNIEKALLINKKLSKETVNMVNELCAEDIK